MASINAKANQYFYACIWALRAGNCKYVKDDLEKINRQISNAWRFAASSEKELINQDYLDQINEKVKNLLKIDDVEKDKLVCIRDTINRIYHSPEKKSPPEAKAESSD